MQPSHLGPIKIFLDFIVRLFPNATIKILDIRKAAMPMNFKGCRRIVTNCQDVCGAWGW